MENSTIYTWLFLGIALSVVSKLLQFRGKRRAGTILVIPAAFCLLTALMFSVTDYARLYSRAPTLAILLLSIAGFLVIIFQLMTTGLVRKVPTKKVKWLVIVMLIGLIAFSQLWQRWV